MFQATMESSISAPVKIDKNNWDEFSTPTGFRSIWNSFHTTLTASQKNIQKRRKIHLLQPVSEIPNELHWTTTLIMTNWEHQKIRNTEWLTLNGNQKMEIEIWRSKYENQKIEIKWIKKMDIKRWKSKDENWKMEIEWWKSKHGNWNIESKRVIRFIRWQMHLFQSSLAPSTSVLIMVDNTNRDTSSTLTGFGSIRNPFHPTVTALHKEPAAAFHIP